MNEVKKDIFSKANDFLESKLGNFFSSFVKLAVTTTVVGFAWSTIGLGGIAAAVIVTALGRKYAGEMTEKYKGMKAFTPFTRLIKDTGQSALKVLTFGKAFVKKYDQNASASSVDAPESASDLGNKSAQGPFNNGKTPAANNNAAPSVAKKHTP